MQSTQLTAAQAWRCLWGNLKKLGLDKCTAWIALIQCVPVLVRAAG